MTKFRYDTSGTWFKGNTHIHSTESDGGMTFDEIGKLYAGAAYDFAYLTDHWVASDVAKHDDAAPLLWMDGIELDGNDEEDAYHHVVCLGRVTGITRDMGFPAALQACRDQGAHLVLAHPHWTGNTMDDAVRFRFDAVEVYNHVCRWLNGKSEGSVHWNAMLEHYPDTLALAVDDAHLREEHPGWNGGWVMINAPELTRENVTSAIRSGNYYSTCGPELHAIEWDGRALSVRTSPVQFVRLVGPGFCGLRQGAFNGSLMSQAVFEAPEEWEYMYLEVEDAQGRRAWTNPLFVSEE